MASWCWYGRFCSFHVPYLSLSACPGTYLSELVQGTEEAENGFFFPLELFLCQFSFLNWITGSSEEHEYWHREEEETRKEKRGAGLHISGAASHYIGLAAMVTHC